MFNKNKHPEKQSKDVEEKKVNEETDIKEDVKNEKETADIKEENKEGALEKEIKELQTKILERDLKIFKLENEIKQINEQYTKRVSEKATEAQKLVDTKIKEYQEKFAHELLEAKKYMFLKDGAKLIEALNNFDMVLSHSNNAGEAVKNYASGFKMVHSLFKKLLHDLHIHEIVVNSGDLFNSSIMEGFEEVESKDIPSGHVIEVLKKGYKLHDKVLAFVLVKISK